MKPIVAIVGRPNVGKSTLFNRLVQRRIAIIEDQPGITRDRIYADTEWNGRTFTLVDTGGIVPDPAETLTGLVRRQAELAIAEADLVVLVLDVRDGLTATDQDVADLLRRARKPVILCANKGDIPRLQERAVEFYRLGLGDPITCSAEHGLGTGDLLDRVVAELPEGEPPPEDEQVIRVAVIGRPNVGKSSLVNALLGRERVIVSEVSGTTRDAIDVPLVADGRNYLLIDTAGMRRRARIDEAVERYSVMRTLRAVDRADVVLTLLEAPAGVTEQDQRIVGYVHEAGKGQILLINKWDLAGHDEGARGRFLDKLSAGLSFLDYAPRLFISARTGQRLNRVMPAVAKVAEACRRRAPTAELNRVIAEAASMTPPPGEGGKRLKLYYATQGGAKPPVFLFFTNEPDLAHFSYRRYLENRLREAFDFEGTPIRLIFKRRSRSETQ